MTEVAECQTFAWMGLGLMAFGALVFAGLALLTKRG